MFHLLINLFALTAAGFSEGFVDLLDEFDSKETSLVAESEDVSVHSRGKRSVETVNIFGEEFRKSGEGMTEEEMEAEMKRIFEAQSRFAQRERIKDYRRIRKARKEYLNFYRTKNKAMSKENVKIDVWCTRKDYYEEKESFPELQVVVFGKEMFSYKSTAVVRNKSFSEVTSKDMVIAKCSDAGRKMIATSRATYPEDLNMTMHLAVSTIDKVTDKKDYSTYKSTFLSSTWYGGEIFFNTGEVMRIWGTESQVFDYLTQMEFYSVHVQHVASYGGFGNVDY